MLCMSEHALLRKKLCRVYTQMTMCIVCLHACCMMHELDKLVDDILEGVLQLPRLARTQQKLQKAGHCMRCSTTEDEALPGTCPMIGAGQQVGMQMSAGE